MTTVESADYPKVSIGTFAHPATYAWAWVERAKGVYDWSIFDSYVEAARQHGLVDDTNTVNMAITFASTPDWATADRRSCSSINGIPECTAPPAKLQDWADFVTAVMQHYNGVTQPHVRYYELWNEFNVWDFWRGNYADLVALARIAYPIIHSDPYSILLTPSVTGPVGDISPFSASTMMARYLDAGGAQYADGGAFHGYIAATGVTPFPMPEEDATPGCVMFSTCFGSIVTQANMMRQVFDDHGLAGKPMFDTEGSWGENNVTDPDTQAAWLARWYLLQAGLLVADNLQFVAWYTWGGGPGQKWGAIESDSQATDLGLAALSYNQVYEWLVGATIAQTCSAAPDSTWTCNLTRPGGYVAQAVWNTTGSKFYTPDPIYRQYRDLAGNATPIPAGSVIPIGAKPVLVEGYDPLSDGSPQASRPEPVN